MRYQKNTNNFGKLSVNYYRFHFLNFIFFFHTRETNFQDPKKNLENLHSKIQTDVKSLTFNSIMCNLKINVEKKISQFKKKKN